MSPASQTHLWLIEQVGHREALHHIRRQEEAGREEEERSDHAGKAGKAKGLQGNSMGRARRARRRLRLRLLRLPRRSHACPCAEQVRAFKINADQSSRPRAHLVIRAAPPPLLRPLLLRALLGALLLGAQRRALLLLALLLRAQAGALLLLALAGPLLLRALLLQALLLLAGHQAPARAPGQACATAALLQRRNIAQHCGRPGALHGGRAQGHMISHQRARHAWHVQACCCPAASQQRASPAAGQG